MTNRQTFCVVLFCACSAAMVFFAVVRAFGAVWFLSLLPEEPLPHIAQVALLIGSWTLEGAIMLRIMTDVGWIPSLFIALGTKIVVVFLMVRGVDYVIEVAYTFALPLICNRDKDRSVGYSLFYLIGIVAYQALMMFGRGYMLIDKVSAERQLVATLDYRLFLLSIYFLRKVVQNTMSNYPTGNSKGGGGGGGDKPISGCFFLFGKFDKAASAVGSAILRPFRAIAKSFAR